jgi:hypothetical protein
LTYLERQKRYGPDKLRLEEAEEAEAEEQIRLKQYVSLHSKGRHNYIYSNKFFHNFHLSETSFTCPRLQASGIARRLA